MRAHIDRSPALVYKAGYKYQLQQPYFIQTPLRPESYVCNGWVSLDIDGKMIFMPAYAWDGVTGAPDTPGGMAASLMHDGGYQLLRAGLLPPESKEILDRHLADVMEADGIWRGFAQLAYWAVRLFGKRFTVKPTETIKLITR